MELHVAPLQAHHSVGAIVWGQGASADTLFASSESQSTTDHTGYHIAFDADQGRPVYEFNAKESGDAMALDPDGSALSPFNITCQTTDHVFTGVQLALCTASHDGTHFLRLYDVCRKNGKCPRQEIQLDAFNVGPGFAQPETHEGEVNTVKFSPDGLLLAVARSDDELHVYDSRFMGRSREPMQRFLHWGEDCCLGGDRWGIVDAVWVDGWCGRGLGVVTGGSDGECFHRIIISIAHRSVFLSKVASVSGTYAGRQMTFRMARCSRSPTLTSATSPLAILTTEKSHSSCGCTLILAKRPRTSLLSFSGDNGGRIYVYDHATACR